MSKYVYLNNKYVNYKDAKIHIEDRGFQFSDSVYEVIKVINGKLLDIEFHLSRLKYSTSELNFNLKINKPSLKSIFLNLVKIFKFDPFSLRCGNIFFCFISICN